MKFRILGPVEAVHKGAVLNLGGPRHRRLLAALLLHAGHVVSVAKLTDALWGESPPKSAPSMLHVRISELRSSLRTDGFRLITRDGGYALHLEEDDDLDAAMFERLIASGAAALSDGDVQGGRDSLHAALALWKGPALAEFANEPFARSEAARLGELRLQALEKRVEADLTLGRHGDLVAELEKLVAEYPLHERFWAQQMVALYRAGRQGEALRAYQVARRHIADQLGLDPGETLQQVHRAILTADESLLAMGTNDGARRSRVVLQPLIPAQLPRDVAGFTGRVPELRQLDELLADPQENAAVVVISGTAGVGKTATAVRWAHQNRERYPDGQLYVNLRGYDPEQPVTAADALAGLLTSLGVPSEDIPNEVDARAARFRTAVTGRQLLILLDNASSVEQVRPLLPGSPTCAVLVTSRDSLAGLVARDGAQRVDLDLLPPDDAHSLLRHLIGPRAQSHETEVSTLADYCAGLPLALRVAAELAVSHSTTPLAALVSDLKDHQRRLEVFDAGGDPHAAVATVFSWSIRHLPSAVARSFRLLGLHPGVDIDAYAVAALSGAGLADARRWLDMLARAHLVEPRAEARYVMHDLLRAFAASLARQHESPEQRHAARQRLSGYYLVVAATAVGLLFPADTRRRSFAIPAPASPIPDLTTPTAALAWLDAERQTMVGMSARAAKVGLPEHAVQTSTILFRYLDGGHNTDALAVHRHAKEAAEELRDVVGQAEAHTGLGVAHLRFGRYDAGAEHFRRARDLFRRANDVLGQARALGNLGIAEQLRGRFAAAAGHQQEALELYRQVGDKLGEARCIDDLGLHEQRLGRYEHARDLHRRALLLFREVDHRPGQTAALNNLGEAEHRLGRPQQAAAYLQEALRLAKEVGDRTSQAWSLTSLGTLHTQAGDSSQGAELHREALAIFQGAGDRDGQPRALNGLGEAAYAMNKAREAVLHHRDALAVAIDTRSSDEQARAHTGLGNAHLALGDPRRAGDHFNLAADLYETLQSPEAALLRARVADLTATCCGASGSEGNG